MEKFNQEAAVRVTVDAKHSHIETPLIIDIISAYEGYKKIIGQEEHDAFTTQKMAIVPLIVGED